MEHGLPRPITLNVTQINAASQVLGRAFQDDPLMVYLVPDASKRKRVLPALFGVATRYCLRYGTIYTTPDLDALVCCLPPGQSKSIGRLALICLSDPPLQLGLTVLTRFMHASKYTGETHKQAAPGEHWYVWVLGVEPERQGHGFGGLVLQAGASVGRGRVASVARHRVHRYLRSPNARRT